MKWLSMNRSAFTLLINRASSSLFLLLAASTIYYSCCLADGMNLRQVAGLRDVVEVAIAPGGEWVAYVLRVPREPLADEDGKAWTELHIVDGEGNDRTFVGGDVQVSRIAWSADGAGVAFLAKRGDCQKKGVHLIPIDGGESNLVVCWDEDIKEFALSPNGERIAFLATIPEDEKTEKYKDKGFNAKVYEETKKRVQIWIGSMDSGGLHPEPLDHEGSASGLRWSPDGTTLVVGLAPTPHIDDRYMKRKIHLLDVETGEILTRIDNPGKLGALRWSTDSEHVMAITGEDAHDPREGRLTVASASGGDLVDLLPGIEGHIAFVGWRGDDHLLFVVDEGVWTTIGEVNRSGGDRTQLVHTGGPIVRGFSLSKNGGRAALIAETPRHPREVYLYDVGRDPPRRLTNSNPWLDQVELATQEVVSYKARDGLDLEGILIRPLQERPGEKYPLVLVIHGGPESHYRNGWSTSYARPGQTAAARGYAVFFPNYRGSTGRGVAFSKLSQGDAAGAEFDDYVDAVDHLMNKGIVDGDRVGITGGSYGGYASAWAATYYSDRFAAAVMNIGVSNRASKWGETDIPNEIYMVHDLKLPWEDYDYVMERSPVYYADRSKTPLLIMHGEKDTRVNPSQSLELYRHLKWRGSAPVRLVYYPEEAHGNTRAAARFDYSVRLMRWMDHYLQGPGGDPPAYAIDYDRELNIDAPSDDRGETTIEPLKS